MFSAHDGLFWAGAKHLYLIDFDPTNLPNLKESIQKKYPDVQVDSFSYRYYALLITLIGHHHSS